MRGVLAPPPIDRWVLSGTLTTLSPMSIRTGEEENSAETDKEGKPFTVLCIERAKGGGPFIPGSAIKGLLRGLAASHEVPGSDYTEHVRALFGDMPRGDGSPNSPQQSLGGACEFRNAFHIGSSVAVAERGRTAIDRGTRGPADAMLRHDRAVPCGVTFSVEIIIDRATCEQLTLLLGLLKLVDGTTIASSLGSGNGRVRFDVTGLKHLNAVAIGKWLASEELDWKSSAPDVLENITPVVPKLVGTTVSFEITLKIEGHFLVSVAASPNPKKGAPNRTPLGGKNPLLPDSSFDGALRSQAERIWRTVHSNPPEDWSRDPPPGPIEELFGSRDRKGSLTPSDFIDASAQAPKRLDFVAIDRLSGAGADGKKFAITAFEAPCLAGSISLRFAWSVDHSVTGQPRGHQPSPLSMAAIGLLALTLRDLAEGDIPFGYGTRKGFGGVAELSFGSGGLNELLEAIGKAAPSGKGRETIVEAVKAFREWREPEDESGIS